jgi:murein hydrolase activator
VLLAGMSQITAEIGQTVRAGEPLATMGSGPSSVTLLGDQVHDKRPVLYIEFRKNGDAIDSAPWWIGGMKEASR